MSQRMEHTQIPNVTGSGGIVVTKPSATTVNIAGAGAGTFGVLQGLNHYTKSTDVDNIIVLPGSALPNIGDGVITLPATIDTDMSTPAVPGVGGSIGALATGWRGLYALGDATLVNPTIIVNKAESGGIFVDPTLGELTTLGYDQSVRIGSFFYQVGAFRNSHDIREFVRNGNQITYTNSADSLVRWLSSDLTNAVPQAAPGVVALEGGSGDNLTGILTTDFSTYPVNFSTFVPPGSLSVNIGVTADRDDFMIFSTPGDSGLTISGGQLVLLYADNGLGDHVVSLEKSIAISAIQTARFRQEFIGSGDINQFGIYVNGYTDRV